MLDDRGWNLHPTPGPGNEPYSEIANYRVRLTVPPGTRVAGTGELVSLEKRVDRWVYTVAVPDVRDWAAVGGTGLHEEILAARCITIRAVADDPDWARRAAAAAAEALPFFEERFGFYRYPELVVICCSGPAMPGLLFAPGLDGRGLWRKELHRGLAHQWFYAAVGNDQFGEPWVDEGFARYAEWQALRQFGPEELASPPGVPRFRMRRAISNSAATFGGDLAAHDRTVREGGARSSAPWRSAWAPSGSPA